MVLGRFHILSLVLMGLWGSTSVQSGTPRCLTWTRFSDFQSIPGETAGHTVLLSQDLAPGFPWNELVVSWNASAEVVLQVEARPTTPVGARFYSFGWWAANSTDRSRRTSLKGQEDALGRMMTDTLVLRQPAEKVQIRLTLQGPREGLKRLSLSFTGPDTEVPASDSFERIWGTDLGVPLRSQADYPEGVDKWCSPTSTAMLMAYWGARFQRPEWSIPVPEVADQVSDPGWGGTGNWPFNMAWVGMHPGLNAAVVRLSGMSDLEHWIASGAPAAVSIRYTLLKGKSDSSPGDGHLVVVRGFTSEGDVIVNDPGVRLERVWRVYRRNDFLRAWNASRRTTYLVWPDGHPLPTRAAFPQSQ